MQVINTREQFEDFINSEGKFTKIVLFSASWSEACIDYDKLILELKNEKEYGTDYEIGKLVAEENEQIAKEYQVKSIPTILAFQKGKLIDRIEGFIPIKLKELLIKSTFDAIALNERLKRLINKERLTLFMKGSPTEPKCGFSQQIVKLLKAHNIQFWTFDILLDEQVRQGLKTYSDWPTYPQLYLDGELLGGIDVVKEEMKDPAFVEKLPKLV
uniref:Glutaredoxin n=1 Tax=Meloidogyne javanica TaxID=6303 RepID=A0A915MGQ1_MELJA